MADNQRSKKVRALLAEMKPSAPRKVQPGEPDADAEELGVDSDELGDDGEGVPADDGEDLDSMLVDKKGQLRRDNEAIEDPVDREMRTDPKTSTDYLNLHSDSGYGVGNSYARDQASRARLKEEEPRIAEQAKKKAFAPFKGKGQPTEDQIRRALIERKKRMEEEDADRPQFVDGMDEVK